VLRYGDLIHAKPFAQGKRRDEPVEIAIERQGLGHRLP
jgi:hypothetical protein